MTESRDIIKQLKLNREQMKEMMFDTKTSDEQVKTKLRQIRQLQEKIEEIQVGDFLAIRKTFTPEQRQLGWQESL